ncbi:MAG: DUF7064 domain-containing protein [Acidimicrobiales bacterium]
MVALRLEPVDEYTHEVGPEENFNESMYFNVVDSRSGLGGFFRLANRPNEGQGEMTCCLWLPRRDHRRRVAFMFNRPDVDSNEAFDAGGMCFDVLEPFNRLEVSYDGKVVLLDDPNLLEDPRAAFRSNPWHDCEVRLTYTGLSPMYGGEPEDRDAALGDEFARGHYEQLVAARGVVRVGHQEWPVDGYGLRDHSWGPRYWQAPWYYRWLTANLGRDCGFMGSRIARRDGDGTRTGFGWEKGVLHPCDDFTLRTEWHPDRPHQAVVFAELRAGDRRWGITGYVESVVPLRNRRETPDGELLVTRIAEGLTRWELDDGRTGWGLSEYLDQVVDGQPVGLAE